MLRLLRVDHMLIDMCGVVSVHVLLDGENVGIHQSLNLLRRIRKVGRVECIRDDWVRLSGGCGCVSVESR